MSSYNLVAIPTDDFTLLKTMEVTCINCYQTVIKAHALRFLEVEDIYKFMEIKMPKGKWKRFNFLRGSKARSKLLEKNRVWRKVEDIKMLISYFSQEPVISHIGIFRVNGSSSHCKAIIDYLKRYSGDLSGLPPDFGVFDLASAFKHIIKSLEPKLIPDELRKRLLSFRENICYEDKVTCISLLIRLLPDHLQAIFFDLFAFLKKLSVSNDSMSPNIIAKLFAPCFTDATMSDIMEIIPIIAIIIENGDRLSILPKEVLVELRVALLRWVKGNGDDIDYVYQSYACPLQPRTNCCDQEAVILREMANIFENKFDLNSSLKEESSPPPMEAKSPEPSCKMSFDSDKENTIP